MACDLEEAISLVEFKENKYMKGDVLSCGVSRKQEYKKMNGLSSDVSRKPEIKT